MITDKDSAEGFGALVQEPFRFLRPRLGWRHSLSQPGFALDLIHA